PSRLEQRNGRLDRHGQARDVHTFHVASKQNADIAFLDHLIRKVDQIREDLGATGELFDEATHRRLIDGEDSVTVQQSLDLGITKARLSATVPVDSTVKETYSTGADVALAQLDALAKELDLDG